MGGVDCDEVFRKVIKMSYEDILQEMFIGLSTDPEVAFVDFERRLATDYELETGIVAQDYVTAMEAFIEIYGVEIDRTISPAVYSLHQIASDGLFFSYKQELRKASLIIQVKLSKVNAMQVFDSIQIQEKFKSDIRSLIDEIKRKIETVSIPDDKKDSLLKKLNHFLHELDQSKTRLAALTSAQIQIATATGRSAEELEPVVGIFERLMKAVGRGAKSQSQLPPWEETKQIEDHSSENEEGVDTESAEKNA